MNYQFREKQFSPQFRHADMVKIKELIDRSITFSLAGMPGVGVTVFLHFLACQDFACFIYVDAYSLSEISKIELYQQLFKELGGTKKFKTEQEIINQCRTKLKELIQENKRIVIIFNRFDQLKKIFDNQLFSDLISLRNVQNDQIVLIFTANKPYIELLPEDITGDRVNLFSKTIYIKPYSEADLQELLSISAQTSIHTPEFIRKALKLSGGHFQLLQLFLKSESSEPALIDRYLRFQLKELYEFLSYHHRKQLAQIAFGKNPSQIDAYLLSIGLVKKIGQNFQLFTPLLADYIRNNAPVRLPAKEKELFNLLKKQLNKVVTKDEIFNALWANSPDSASDWALNALIYRLKKNPGFKQSGYLIESHKKIGYSLIKNN